MKNQEKTTKSMWYKRSVKVGLIILAIIMIPFVGLYFWQLYKDANPQSYINFTQYEPAKIIGDQQIERRTLEVWAPNELLWFMPTKFIVDLNLSKGGSYISESKATVKDVSLDEFQCSAVGVECSLKQTSGGQKYTLYILHSPEDLNQEPLTYTKLSEERVYFIKGETSIAIFIRANGGEPFADNDWSSMIDSFAPTTFKDLHVKHMYPGP